MLKIVFVIPPSVELLDLSGPLQVFTEAQFYGFQNKIEFYSLEQNVVSSVGLHFDKLENYKNAELKEGDFIFLPGMNFESLIKTIKKETHFFKWLAEYSTMKINICSICNAAFILGMAGLLDNRKCTTHWRRIDLLKSSFPKAKVLDDVLFVKSDNIYTSAGISAGIDLALEILVELKNPIFVNKVSRGLVVYHRRSSEHTQKSIYLDYRNHINPKIHEVQDYMIANIVDDINIEKLAIHVHTSPRNLSRIFKKSYWSIRDKISNKIAFRKGKNIKKQP